MLRLQKTSSDPIVKATTPFYLHTFDRFESLLKSRRTLYDDGRMVALDLGSPIKR